MQNVGIELIKRFEGCKLQAYKCPAGVWTIGYGHTKGVKEGDVITAEQAVNLLVNEIAHFEEQVEELLFGTRVNANQHDALVSFAYNLGIGNLKKSTLLKKVRANCNDPSIRNEFLRWVNAGGRKLEGLVKRRQAEADLYFL